MGAFYGWETFSELTPTPVPFPFPSSPTPVPSSLDFPFERRPVSVPGPVPVASSPLAEPPVDWKETPEAHVFIANLPGLRKEEVLVAVEKGNVLQISGWHTEQEKEQEQEDDDHDDNETWHHVERSIGSFLRRFQLPKNAKMDLASAAMENGVLTVTIPKEDLKKLEINWIDT